MLGVLLAALPARAQDEAALAALRTALGLACAEAPGSPDEMARGLGARGLSDDPLVMRGRSFGWRRGFELTGGDQVEIARIAPGGRLRRLHAEYRRKTEQDTRPVLAAMAGPDCRILHLRRLSYGTNGSAERLEILDEGFAPLAPAELLNPPVPPGTDPGGVPVALLDAGVNYLLPAVTAALARDQNGQILGYDYWDLDARPFDANPARSAFFPVRHGTRVASVLLAEAPGIRLVPYRYPRPDLTRLSDMVAGAARAGVRLVSISLGSNTGADWTAFEAAAEAHPEMLFVVSAGNNGRDIDAAPVYPAALELENMLVVTSAEDDGSLARGSNWGAVAVDLMVPGERQAVIDFRGARAQSSGSSFAAPRVTALAARLLAANPSWRTAKLKAAILARASHTAATRGRIAHGWIEAPERD
jgi:hypothetical protein